MSSSEAVTRGVRVQVQAEFSPAHSQPHQNRWFFLYTVTITNESDAAVQLVTRHWLITDASSEVQEVRGPGVVGKQPVLEPGQSFKYTSGWLKNLPMQPHKAESSSHCEIITVPNRLLRVGQPFRLCSPASPLSPARPSRNRVDREQLWLQSRTQAFTWRS